MIALDQWNHSKIIFHNCSCFATQKENFLSDTNLLQLNIWSYEIWSNDKTTGASNFVIYQNVIFITLILEIIIYPQFTF